MQEMGAFIQNQIIDCWHNKGLTVLCFPPSLWGWSWIYRP